MTQIKILYRKITIQTRCSKSYLDAIFKHFAFHAILFHCLIITIRGMSLLQPGSTQRRKDGTWIVKREPINRELFEAVNNIVFIDNFLSINQYHNAAFGKFN